MNDIRPQLTPLGRRRGIGRACLLAAGLLILAGAAAVFQLREDAVSVAQPVAGDLTGTLAPTGEIASVSAVSRVTGRRYDPAEWDAATGRFLFRSLPGDASYDLCLRLTDGRRVEGVDLSWFEARFLRLAAIRRKQLGIPGPPEHTFTAADAAELVRFIADRKDFSDINRPLYIRGDGGRAVMLVERVRTERFHGAKPDEIIWRTDLMYFTYDAGGWQILPNTRRLVERKRFGREAFATFTISYDAALTAYIDNAGRSRPIVYTIRPEPSAATGRLAGQSPATPAEPVVLGADGPDR